jgi:hypothetical protein
METMTLGLAARAPGSSGSVIQLSVAPKSAPAKHSWFLQTVTRPVCKRTAGTGTASQMLTANPHFASEQPCGTHAQGRIAKHKARVAAQTALAIAFLGRLNLTRLPRVRLTIPKFSGGA